MARKSATLFRFINTRSFWLKIFDNANIMFVQLFITMLSEHGSYISTIYISTMKETWLCIVYRDIETKIDIETEGFRNIEVSMSM